MKRKRRISRLKREIKRLHKENKQLHDKHWSECRQIALYDDEVRKAKGGATLRDYVRMCNAQSSCKDCLLGVSTGCSGWHNCQELLLEEPTAEALISQWCAEHPEQPKSESEQPTKKQKTYKEDFLEKFPNACLKDSGIPWTCRDNAYGILGPCVNRRCVNCWNEVMPDD